MATRFYFPSLTIWTPPFSPAADAAWDDATLASENTVPRVMIMTSVPSPAAAYPTVTAARTATGTAPVGPANILVRAFLSVPLVGNQTITGTVKGQFGMLENNASANAMPQMGIRVITPSNTVRGTLLALHSNALSSELPTGAPANRKNPLAALSPASLSSVSAQDGDRILIEVGVRKEEVATTSRTYTYILGTDDASDAAENETDTTEANSWVEFSQTLTLQDMPPRLGSLSLTGMGF